MVTHIEHEAEATLTMYLVYLYNLATKIGVGTRHLAPSYIKKTAHS